MTTWHEKNQMTEPHRSYALHAVHQCDPALRTPYVRGASCGSPESQPRAAILRAFYAINADSPDTDLHGYAAWRWLKASDTGIKRPRQYHLNQAKIDARGAVATTQFNERSRFDVLPSLFLPIHQPDRAKGFDLDVGRQIGIV